MEKPSFQFGLKAVFVVMTAVAILLADATGFVPAVGLLCVFTHWLLVRPTSAERKD